MKTVLQHIAIICDGNRRWARKQGLAKVYLGHKRALDSVFQPLILHAQKLGISHLTFWIFSTENWKRDKREVAYLLDLFRNFFDAKLAELHKHDVRINVIGDVSAFPEDIQQRITEGEARTAANTGISVHLAMNYGGRDELTRCFQKLAKRVATGELQPEKISSELISQSLDTAKVPDPELIIRTSGEQRMSGFFLWQQEYSEFLFPNFDFPEFTPEKLDQCLTEFRRRQRRFGGG